MLNKDEIPDAGSENWYHKKQDPVYVPVYEFKIESAYET